MDRYRRFLVRIPGRSFMVAAALTVTLEAAIGIGASISVASGLPSVTPPKLPNVTSGLGSTVSSATSGAGSAVSNATGAVPSALHGVTSAASNTEQSLVPTATNLPSSATSAAGSATQAVTGAGGGSAAAPGTSAGSPAGASAASTGSGASGRTSSASPADQSASGARGSASGSGSHPAQHPWFVRRVLTRLSGCVEELPRQSQQVLVLAAGIGSDQPRSASRVAHILGMSLSREERIENSAVASLERAGRHGSCQSSGTALPVSAVAIGLEPGLVLVSGPQPGGAAFLSAAQTLFGSSGHKASVRALRLSRRHPGGGGAGSSRVERSAIGSPSATSSLSAWIIVLLGLAAGAAFLLVGRQRLRARPSGAGAAAGPAAAGIAVALADTSRPLATGPAPGSLPGDGDSGSWDPPTATVPMAAVASGAARPGADSPAPLAPDSPASAEPSSAPIAPASATEGIPVSRSAGRPRVRAGRSWVRRHRQAAAMIGAVAGATLAMMVGTAGRSAGLIARRRRRRRR